MKRKHGEDDQELQSTSYGDGKSWFRGPMIGKGSFGSVYLANLKKPKLRYSCFPPVMAVKSADVSVSGSLQKEKEVLNNLQGCSYILECIGEESTIDSNGQMVFNLLLEYASGGDLASRIKKSDGCRLPESEVRRYTRSILLGIKHIHDLNYVHCDLKPENILLVPTTTSDSEFVAKIGDFGLTKRAKQRRLDPYLRGTPLYMSPEVVIYNNQGRPSDIWALGCVVLEMLTGNPPWDMDIGEDDDDLFDRIATEDAVPTIPDEISEDGKAFLKGCFERKPKSRPTSEMLLNHPFVAGLDEDEDEDEEVDKFEAASVGEEACSSSSSLFNEDSFQFSDFSFTDDSRYSTKDGFLDSAWLKEPEECQWIKRYCTDFFDYDTAIHI